MKDLLFGFNENRIRHSNLLDFEFFEIFLQAIQAIQAIRANFELSNSNLVYE